MTAVERLVQYWDEFYRRHSNGQLIVEELLGSLKEIQLHRQKFENAYDSVMNAIGDQITYYPEAYFGYLNDDIHNDVLGLFMNPSTVKHGTGGWNGEVVRQYTEWGSAKYLEECGTMTATSLVKERKTCGCYLNVRHKDGCLWRWDRYDELRGNFGLTDFRFLHSFELFPFHSQKFDKRIKDHILEMVNLPFMQLTLQAVREISENQRVRAIIGIGKAWEDVLDTMTWYSKTSESFEGSVRTRVIHYQSVEQATPIVILSRQTKHGVKYVIPPAAINYVCSIIGTQPADLTLEEPRPHNANRRKHAVVISEIGGQLSILEEVSQRVLDLTDDSNLYAGRSVAPAKAGFVYKHLWFLNKEYWDNELCSFHIHIRRQVDPIIIIRFGFNVNKLGWSEERVLSMKRKMDEISSLLGLEPTMGRAVYAIERKFDHVDNAAACLAALILRMKQAMEDLALAF